MSKYIRITERIAGKLKPKEAYLYYCLALKSDFHTHESDIKQETLAKEYGIKDTDQISDWLYHFQSCGLLTVIKTNIKDLGAPDGLIVIGGIAINLLPILMTLINVISSALYLKGFPLKTKIQLYGMAAFFLVFLYNSPSALVFYWTLNNLFSLIKTNRSFILLINSQAQSFFLILSIINQLFPDPF